MTMSYIEACQHLPWRQSFDLDPYAWTQSGWRRYGSPLDETEPASLGSGKTELTPKGSGKTELVASRSGETKPAALGSVETF